MKRRLPLIAIVVLSGMLVAPFTFLSFVRVERWIEIEHKDGRRTETDEWYFIRGSRAVQINFISVEKSP